MYTFVVERFPLLPVLLSLGAVTLMHAGWSLSLRATNNFYNGPANSQQNLEQFRVKYSFAGKVIKAGVTSWIILIFIVLADLRFPFIVLGILVYHCLSDLPRALKARHRYVVFAYVLIIVFGLMFSTYLLQNLITIAVMIYLLRVSYPSMMKQAEARREILKLNEIELRSKITEERNKGG